MPRLPERLFTPSFAFVGVSLWFAAAAAAQCATDWLPGGSAPGTNGAVHASVLWDPDGPGPLSAVLVLGGDFTVAGGVVAHRIASYDPATGVCAPLGMGMDANVRALLPMPNGDLLAGGSFTTAGGTSASFVARWNGSSWSSLGTGLTPYGGGVSGNGVRALALLPTGEVVAGGMFELAGGVPVGSLARWNGTAWTAFGAGVALGQTIEALTVMPNGELIAGGLFTAISGVAANYIASWNGTSWAALGSGIATATTYAEVRSLLPLPNGDLIVGGSFLVAGGATAYSIARWSAGSWTPVGGGIAQPFASSTVLALTRLANGDLIAAGSFGQAGGTAAASIARWDGVAWSPLGSGVAGPSAVATLATLANGDVFAGGSFKFAGGNNAPHAARWNASVWAALPPATVFDGAVQALAVAPNGDLVAGGDFLLAGGSSASRIARHNGTGWSPLGTGINGQVRAVCIRGNGDILAGGTFSNAGGISAGNLARWNGTAWVAMPFVFPVNALLALPNGDVIVGSDRGVERWNGTAMLPLGAGLGLSSGFPRVYDLAQLPNGDIVVGGGFTSAGGTAANSIARWDGTSWSTYGNGFTGWLFFPPTVRTLGVLSNGDVVASGEFLNAGGLPLTGQCVRWNGAAWVAMGTGSPAFANAMARLPSGDLLVAGSSTYLAPNTVQRWNGASWAPVGSTPNGFVNALAYLPSGGIAAGGTFTAAGAQVSAFFGTLTSNCAASTSAFAAGCVGSGGTNSLAATALPWVGATFRATASGLPTGVSLAAAVYGLGTIPALPLAALLPQGGIGCTLDVSPDFHVVYVAALGTLVTELSIPNSASLVGAQFHEQVVTFELDPFANIVLVTSTNALTATIGVL